MNGKTHAVSKVLYKTSLDVSIMCNNAISFTNDSGFNDVKTYSYIEHDSFLRVLIHSFLGFLIYLFLRFMINSSAEQKVDGKPIILALKPNRRRNVFHKKSILLIIRGPISFKLLQGIRKICLFWLIITFSFIIIIIQNFVWC